MTIKPFNGVFCALFAVMILLTVHIWFVSKDKSESFKEIFLCTLCLINLIAFFVYKFMLSLDKEFLVLSGIDKFNWFDELPLQLCNINMFLIPFGVLKKNRFVLGFSFFLAPLGALMALIFPEPAFTGFYIFTPRILGYYFTHMMIVICGLSISTLGFYRPRIKDMPGIAGVFSVIAFGAHIVNTLLRLGLCPQANYFYTYGADISILNFFWKIIPFPFFYELPALLILFSYMLIVIFIFKIFKIKDTAQKSEIGKTDNVQAVENEKEAIHI